MEPTRWREIEGLLDEALDLPREERDSFLTERCGSDYELRREVEGLLHSCDMAEAEGHFEEPPREVLQDALLDANAPLDPGPSQVGRRVGAYRIVRLLGRGGMGAVYLAERADGEFQKRVAIKVVKRGMDTYEILSRFHHERQILARLQHPNIAALLDGGATDDGLPYFVMELAEGEAIDVYCDRHRYDLKARLRLFQTVCEAVQYAHRNLVVHRDLKPSNVLVTREGEVKLLDFGIAKVLDDDAMGQTAVTALYTPRLTPEYAAPEQVRGEPTTTATDVYSLGVILYELLTGHPPYTFDQRVWLHIQEVICERRPALPSTVAFRRAADPAAESVVGSAAEVRLALPRELRQQLAGDLDAIILKALQKEPERRYATAAELAEDVRRHLEGRPVRAQPDTRRYRISKFVRRNKKTVALTAAVALALVGGIITTSWQASVARRQSAERLREARRAEAANEFLVSTLAKFDPDFLRGQRTFTHEDLIQRGLETLNDMDRQPGLQASVMNILGQVVFNLGERERADSLFRAAYELLQSQSDSLELATSMVGIGRVLQRDLDHESAVPWFRRALDIYERSLDPADPRLAFARIDLAFGLYTMGGDSARAEADSLARLARTSPLLDEAGQSRAAEVQADVRLARARAAARRGEVETARAKYAEAETLYREALRRRSHVLGEQHPDIGRLLWGVARSVAGQERTGEAREANALALEILSGAYPEPHRDVAFAHLNLAGDLYRQGNAPEAEVHYLESARISGIVNPAGFYYTATAWFGAARAQLQQGRFEKAEASFKRALEEYRLIRLDQQDAPNTVAYVRASQHGLGAALEGLGRDTEAATLYKAAYWEWPEDSRNDDVGRSALEKLAALYERQPLPDSAARYRALLQAPRR